MRSSDSSRRHRQTQSPPPSPQPDLPTRNLSDYGSHGVVMAEAVDDVSKLAEKADVAEPISRSDKPILDLSPAEGLELLCDNDLWPRVLASLIKATTDRNITYKAINGKLQGTQVRGTDEEDGDTRIIDDVEQNKKRVKAGQCIRASKYEHKRSKFYNMYDFDFVSMPLDPGSSKLYRMDVLKVIEDWAFCLTYMTKGHEGWQAGKEEFRQLFGQVFQQGANYNLAKGCTQVFFTTNEVPDYQLLYLEPCWVPLSTYIALEPGTFTPESKVRIHDSVIRNDFIKDHIGASLAGITGNGEDVEERAEQIRKLGVPGPGEKIELGKDGIPQKVIHIESPKPSPATENTEHSSENHISHSAIAERSAEDPKDLFPDQEDAAHATHAANVAEMPMDPRPEAIHNTTEVGTVLQNEQSNRGSRSGDRSRESTAT